MYKIIVLCLVVLVPQIAIGQTEEDIERITTTASRVDKGQSGLPLSLQIVDEETLQWLSASHVEEVLKLVAGAQLQRGNGQEYLPSLRSQVFSGAGACGGILTAEDGIALRAAGFCNINEMFEAHTEMAERVEVLKGPGSVLYGSNAVHGVINVITPDTTKGGGLLALDTGSFGYQRGKFRAGTTHGDHGVGVNVSATHDSGYRTDEGFDQQKVNLRYQFNGDALSITSGLTYTHLDQETAGYITGFESYKNSALAQGNENPEAYRNATSLRLWSEFAATLKNGDKVTVTPYYRNQDMDFLMHFLPGQPVEENAQEGVGIQSLWEHPLSEHITVTSGLDGEFTRGTLLQFQEGETSGSAFLMETIPSGKHYDYDVDATVVAPFVAVEWLLNNWRFNAGLRYEHMAYRYTNNMNSGRLREDGTVCGFGGCRYTRPPSGNNYFNNLSPKLGAVYQWSDALQFYANVSMGFRAPQATELYRLQRAQTVASLSSERANNIEFGLRGNFSDLRISGAIYRMDKDNFIFRDSDFFYVNDGKSRHTGIELETEWLISSSWTLTSALSLAEHTYRHNQVLNDVNINGNLIDSAPRSVFDIRLAYAVSPSAKVEAEWYHTGSYYTDPENQHEYEGHDIVNVRASWDLSQALTIYGRVNNVFDTAYAERADFTSFTAERYFPGRPRNFMFSLIYRWDA